MSTGQENSTQDIASFGAIVAIMIYNNDAFHEPKLNISSSSMLKVVSPIAAAPDRGVRGVAVK